MKKRNSLKSPRKECRLQAGVLQALGSLGLARQVRVCVLSLTRASHPSCLPTSYCCCCGIIASMLQAYFFSLPTLFFPVLLGCVACALCFCDRWCGQDMDNPGAACRQQQHHFTPGHRVLPQPHGHASRSAQATPH